MKQEGYLDEKGQPIVKEPIDPKKLIRNISIVVLVVLIRIFIGLNRAVHVRCFIINGLPVIFHGLHPVSSFPVSRGNIR